MTFADFSIELSGKTGEEVQTTCPQCSTKRKNAKARCLSVNTAKGVWLCHHCDWRGSLKSGEDRPGKRLYTRPIWNEKAPTSDLYSFFDLRGIMSKIVDLEGITEVSAYLPQCEDHVPCVAFPYRKKGEVVNIKYRGMKEKAFSQVTGAEKVLFRQDWISATKPTVIVEGELDALSVIQAGVMEVVSVPDGAPAVTAKNYASKFTYLDQDPDPFEHAPSIILAVDADEPGEVLKRELARRLGSDRCSFVTWPEGCKDANDVLVKRGAEVLKACIDQAKPFPVQDVVEVDDICEEVCRDYYAAPSRGFSTGWTTVDQFYTVEAGQLTVVTGVPSSGKALALNTPIPTPHGWTTMKDLEVGHTVYDEQGQPCRVVGVTEVMHDRPCYRLTFSDRTSIVADAEHQWFTYTQRAKRSARMAKVKGRELPRPLLLGGTDQTHKRTFHGLTTTERIAGSLVDHGKNNHAVQVCQPIKGGYRRLPIHPYTLGAWLGDGNSQNAGICAAEDEVIQEIERDGYPMKKWGGRYHYGIGGGFQSALRAQNLLQNKHIPSQYLRASIAQRKALLAGLMDTDGHIAKDGRCEWTNMNAVLSHHVYELIVSLGLKTSFTTGRAKLYGKDCGEKYRVCFRPTDWSPFRMARKTARVKAHSRNGDGKFRTIVSCEPIASVPVKCIQVDSLSHMYLCSESFVPTHNSEWLDALALNLATLHGWRFAVCSPENAPVETHCAKLVEKQVGKPFWVGITARMSPAELAEGLGWLHEHVTFIMPEETLTVQGVLDRAAILVRRKGIKGLIIDPFNEFDHTRERGQTETEYIGQVLGSIKRWARKFGVHVWLVAHPQKLYRREDGSYPVPTPYDINGSANFRNKADNCLTVWRNMDEPELPIQIHVQKVRFKHIGSVGMAELLWEKKNGRYRTPVNDTEVREW